MCDISRNKRLSACLPVCLSVCLPACLSGVTPNFAPECFVKSQHLCRK
ncbi:MAG: hypothetical protein ACRC4N_15210 [Gammaproteobacteria bacterium]